LISSNELIEDKGTAFSTEILSIVNRLNSSSEAYVFKMLPTDSASDLI
jgi:hypothetical protein